MHNVILTFDTEDFISENSVWILRRVLEELKKHDLEAIFFITGHMAEKLQDFNEVVDLLNEHEIGYHSSSHSVHPAIYEFTDLADYEEAYNISLQRETAHINPATGEIEGKGGIFTLKELFHKKQIKLFRAPGHCWAPPHLEALRSLGITFDFSTNLSSMPVNFKGFTFYPYPIMGHWEGTLSDNRTLLISLLKRRLAILTVHPSLLANKTEWDSIYFISNPRQLSPPQARSTYEIRHLLHNFSLLLDRIAWLKKMHVVETTPNLERTNRKLSVNQYAVTKCYQKSIRWALKQEYRPKFLFQHFLRFFETSVNT